MPSAGRRCGCGGAGGAYRYIEVDCLFSLPKDTHEYIDITDHGGVYTNDTDGTPFYFAIADYTGENFQLDTTQPDRVFILTDGLYSLRYRVGVNTTFFPGSVYTESLYFDGAIGDSQLYYIDSTSTVSVGAIAQATFTRVFHIASAPTYIRFGAAQRSGNDWVRIGPGDTSLKQGEVIVEFHKWV